MAVVTDVGAVKFVIKFQVWSLDCNIEWSHFDEILSLSQFV